jgi:hypothetical protein
MTILVIILLFCYILTIKAQNMIFQYKVNFYEEVLENHMEDFSLKTIEEIDNVMVEDIKILKTIIKNKINNK